MNFNRALLAAALIAGPAFSASAQDFILVQSTTSTANSGLFDHILPQFTEKTGTEVRVVAVGTGQAIKNAMNCDGDVLLVHSRAREDAFVAEGFAPRRYDVMYNDFVMVGPEADPAEISGMTDAAAALNRIAEAEAPFASRGDDSGTHGKEKSLWKAAGVDQAAASGRWYRETGSGMGATINAAVGMGAYTLTDRATWSSYGAKGDYEIVVEGDPALFNPYGVMLVSADKCPSVKTALGQEFIDWLVGSEGQAAIASFQIGGEQQFFPSAAEEKVGG
ncbi:substrate-binding domain-containing protein [Rubrimonas cliftonensis]|uniref:Tungstate transport system substrate-binding protein n=1 Tax=Rubrimonas cliftonensis TaxID=89524 RepID=A0A1H4AHJ2_9RHOB|nr:substrate-binding domain-containing protein [Rubrimonas cliftonensis]SEA35400.1 tungstate transport system substrate-binding protein [Rubrimonas cliftonensis]